MSNDAIPEWEQEPGERRPVFFALLAASAIIVVAGIGAIYATKEPAPPEPVADVAELTDGDEGIDSAAEVAEEEGLADRAVMAQEEVARLQGELDEAMARIDEFEANEAKSAERSAEARKRWKEMEAEVARLQVALSEAEAERDSLRTELASTLEELDKQIEETRRVAAQRDTWKKASNENLWAAFVQSTKVKLCDRGNRRSLSRCHELVQAALTDDSKERFDSCVRTHQAVPTLVKLDRNAQPPEHSEPIPSDVKQIKKGWHIVYCDPTLPESSTVADANDLPQPVVASLGHN